MEPPSQQSHIAIVEAFEARHRTGLVTVLFTDMADSTRLKSELGDVVAGALIHQHHTVVRQLLATFPASQEVSTAGDSFFIVFDSPSNAVLFSLQLHAEMRKLSARVKHRLRDRIGIHVGEVFVEVDASHGRTRNFSGIHIDTAARVMGICEPERILLTRFCFDNARQVLKGKVVPGVGQTRWVSHGLFALKGVSGPVEICEVGDAERVTMAPLADSEKAQRVGGVGLPAGAEAGGDVAAGEQGSFVDRCRARVRRQWREGLVGAGASVGLALLLWATPVGQRILLASYDLAFVFRVPEVPPEVVIVYQDDASVEPLGQKHGVPWDRAVHARLIERLVDAGAKAVVLDYLFDLPGPSPSDRRLIAAVSKGTNVFLAASAEEVRGLEGTRTELPFEALRSVARWGFVERAPRHEIARRHYSPPEELGVPSLAELVAGLDGRGAAVGREPRWFNFYGPPKTLRSVSYAQALNPGDTPDALFKGKVVFVGDLAGVAQQGGGSNLTNPHRDDFITPYTGRMSGKAPGVELLATAYLNVVRGDWLRRMPFVLEILLVVGLGGVQGFVLALLRPRISLMVGVGLGVVCGVMFPLLMWGSLMWWGWALVVFVEIPAAVLVSLLYRNERLKQQNRTLEETIVTQQTEFITRASLMKATEAIGAPARPADGKPEIPDHELFRVIGKGAYGEVWLGRDLTGSFRAVKLVRAAGFKSARPFEREFEGVKRFAPISREHPGLIQVLHVGRLGEDCFFTIMEAADDQGTGETITPATYQPDSLSSRLAGERRLAPEVVRGFGLELCDALEFLHGRGLIHRDIKPANLLFVRGRLKLADVGLVTEVAGPDRAASMVGTPAYMAPEGPGTVQSDIYSLGMVLYEVAMGKRAEVFPELPTEVAPGAAGARLYGLNKVILKACEPQPAQRFASAREFREALLAL